MTPRLRIALLCSFAAAGSACASAQTARVQRERAEAAVDSIRYQKPLSEVWNEVRRILHQRGVPLAVDDLDALGLEHASGILVTIFTPAKATAKDPVGGQALETGWSGRKVIRVRYRVWGTEDSRGTRIVMTQIDENTTERGRDSSDRRRAVELELDLARRLDPAAAERVEAAITALGG